ncbi:hypothetical protein [Rhodanobacter sp. MP1X3]|uniref:hypothetical protein n=1 Tax=Rhodanobacter sp. MP1X3 TaxID=2723086 RepID=UPI0017DD922A|nr:hypothetical protein [Rhodanobacter sp. MP1X3]MBB6243714.1 hypothetical protein [Rhodanobacter sp. MP1X3]
MQANFVSAAQSRRLVTPAEALYAPEFLALPSPANPARAAGLRIARRRFPLPLVKVDGRNMVRIEDIHRFIDGLRPVEQMPDPAPRRRGRPRKARVSHD